MARARVWVAVAAGLAFLLKVMLAFRTYGTGDIGRWQVFADGVRSSGPVGVYALTWPSAFYNHPPAIGYFLQFVNGMQDLGVSLGATIRVTASLADVVTAFVVFELLRRRTTLVRAMSSGVLVAVSPVLFTVSGYHGNTDPIFTMLTLLSVWLLADRDRPLLAGMSMGLALGVKIIPIVAVPALLVYAATLGARTFWRYAVGGALVFAITWGPALVLQGHNVIANVIGYKGSDLRQWGLIQIGHWLGDPWWATFLIGPGRFVVLVLCCAGPAYLVWRRPWVLPGAVGLSLVGFLLLSPAFGVQYAVWPLAGAYLIGFASATAYNMSAGLMLVAIYNRWSHGLPWDRAQASKYTPTEVFYGMLAWVALLWVAVVGVRTMLTSERPEPAAQPRTKSGGRAVTDVSSVHDDDSVSAPDER
ncbi:hypothetical protein ABIB25_003183 [Nakamurella sp. UYEF19]|uniref:glycosyltransferase family 39 protein n=1 Tax=Nakamurella sp. UYEF19 TaxID=1756392 RepID=UPI003399797E